MVKEFNESQDKIEVIAEHQGDYDDLMPRYRQRSLRETLLL
ncbi:hypothetical protein PAAL109150_26365 [Paenibacillus alkaliterrae]|nr:hypothetical protein [Paenibacillus alkaliterrae]